MDVVFSCDDAGARLLRVTVWSLLRHYRGGDSIRINVFEGFGGHSAESKRLLADVVGRFPRATVRYLNVEKAIEPYADLIMNREKSRWNVFTWTPIFTPMLLSDATGNVAHFDIDMLFNDDVSKLLDLDLGDNLIAAVAEYGKGDPVITEAVWGKGILPPEADRYFNTGTIVFKTAKCREERTWEKILAWYREHYDIADRIEQDAWNALYWKRTKLLPLRWNFHDRLIKSYVKWNLSEKYWQGNPPRECLEAALNPAILHFWGPKKPWKPGHRPYRKLYHEAMRAVGQKPPREPILAPCYNLAHARILKAIRFLYGIPEQYYPLDRYRRRIVFRRAVKSVGHVMSVPFEWAGILLALAVLPFLPHRVLVALCDAASAAYFFLDRRGRALAVRNMRLVYGRQIPQERLVIRRAYRNMARTVGHIFWTCVCARTRVSKVGEMDDGCRAFLAARRPAITVSAHVGCWEILSQLAYLEGHRMMSVAKRIGTSRMTRLLMYSRRSIGQEIVAADGAFRFLLGGIRKGKSLGLLVDQRVDPKNGGLWIRFLGRPMPVSAAPAFFAAKTKTPILVAWSRPLAAGRYRCEFVDVIEADDARDVWGCTQRIATDLERIVRRHPSCWVLNYDYFSHIPSEDDLRTLKQREART